jgi:replicative DNA helicase
LTIHQSDLLAEQRLLQTIYNQPEFLDQVTEDLFSTRSNQNIFNSVVALRDNNTPFSRDALFQEYLTRDLDGNSTTIDVISKPQNAKLESIDDIIVQLKDFRKRREAEIIIEEITKDLKGIAKLDSETVEKIKEKLTRVEVAISIGNENKKVMNMIEWFDEYEEALRERQQGNKQKFCNFIFDSLVQDGPRPGEIGLIVSASGSGKSTLALNLISDFIDALLPCMYFSLEMSSITTLDRLVSKRLGIPYAEITSPKEQNEFEGVLAAINSEKQNLIQNNKFRFSEDASISLAQLYQHIKKFQADLGDTYCIVVVDLLSMITDFCKNSANMAQQIEISINKLSAMSKELGVHIIGVLQYNHNTESQAGHIRDVKDISKFRPNRAQIKNSNAWMERARYVLSTFRPKSYAQLYLPEDEIMDMIDNMEVSIIKVNNGQIGKRVSALFDGETFNVTPQEEDDTPQLSGDEDE